MKAPARAVKVTPHKPEDLFLDPQNPRLAGRGLTVDQQEDILRILWDEFSVNEIVDSILASGFWRHEELFATKEGGRLIVIEGNRRLAAVKALRDPDLRRRAGVPDLAAPSKEVSESLASLPVIECSREEVWEFIGFKHVNGPEDWDSVAKAEYIGRVHNTMGIGLDRIAKTIGDRHDTVRRLYAGLMVLEQAEETGQFTRADSYKKHFAFSHLWTGLGYPGVRSFLGLPSARLERPNPVPKKKLQNLGEFCRWLYGSRKDKVKPIVISQNPHLRQLDEALQSPDGLSALRNDLPLETAIKLARGDEQLLRDALVRAETALREGKAYFATGFQGQKDMLEKISTVHRLADSLLTEAESIDAPSRPRGGRRTGR